MYKAFKFFTAGVAVGVALMHPVVREFISGAVEKAEDAIMGAVCKGLFDFECNDDCDCEDDCECSCDSCTQDMNTRF